MLDAMRAATRVPSELLNWLGFAPLARPSEQDPWCVFPHRPATHQPQSDRFEHIARPPLSGTMGTRAHAPEPGGSK